MMIFLRVGFGLALNSIQLMMPGIRNQSVLDGGLINFFNREQRL